jgi:tetratricopeptide (TPR) repeat protein
VRRFLVGLLVVASLAPAAAFAQTCDDWAAVVVSVQGIVETRRSGQTQWVSIALGGRLCHGDAIRVHERSRAGVVMRNEALLRLDQNTTVTFAGPPEQRGSWAELVTGVVHFISRVPRGLKILTPFVNGTVEGTEFWVQVFSDHAIIAIVDGRVTAENAGRRLTVGSGESAVGRAGQPPSRAAIVNPRDAVQWALYYPAVSHRRPAQFPDIPGEAWPEHVRRSVDRYVAGDLAGAFAALAPVPPNVRDPRVPTYRAELLLAVGRVDEARTELARALTLDPRHGPALGLQAIIAVVQNDKASAMRLARAAVDADEQSSASWVALSYAEQASFDLRAALASLEQAVTRDPGDALAWARLSELRLSFGFRGDALAAARTAASLEPRVARTHTVLGFADLADGKIAEARASFVRAITLDQADPWPRLGLGLALIRDGDLEGGRRTIEIAALLDPRNALVRSYLGKAYHEERREKAATEEFDTAKGLDDRDPTPWFYRALQRQTMNRPVEALHDLLRAIELNDNRAVYRSRLLLDEDLAARSASLARLYDELGFHQLALVEGWKSLAADPTNHAAHRFLAELYATLPRHEVARVSEALQSQLLQRTNINPLPPRLAVRDLFITEGTGPADISFNEFNPLFNRNRASFRATGLLGVNGTAGDEVVVSGVWNDISLAIAQFHYETNGFRENSDFQREIYDGFLQWTPSSRLSLQAEYRDTDFHRGDVALRFDPDNFSGDLRQRDRVHLIRLGARATIASGSDVLASFIHQDSRADARFGTDIISRLDDEGALGELQYLFRSTALTVITGGGYLSASRRFRDEVFGTVSTDDRDVSHVNGYLYATLTPHPSVAGTVGVSVDSFDGGPIVAEQVNPKVGIVYTSPVGTTVRAALVRVLQRTLLASQTIEPTAVAGFNQFFEDGEGTRSWRYGAGIDQKIGRDLFLGAEATRREMMIPFLVGIDETEETRWQESVVRAYLYWTAHDWVAATAEYRFERLHRTLPLADGVTKATTHRVPLGLAFFHPSGARARIKTTYVQQTGEFENSLGEIVPGRDRFWVTDASVGYRLPRRLGLLSIEVKNLFNERFRYQDTDPRSPAFYPERLVIGRLTLGY